MAISEMIFTRVGQIENEIYNFVQNGAGNNIMEANREDASNFDAIMHMLKCRLQGQRHTIGENRTIFEVGHLFFEVDLSVDQDGDGFFEIVVRDSLDKFNNLSIDDDNINNNNNNQEDFALWSDEDELAMRDFDDDW
jgi:hypothetical protein